jgi:putative endonuclease
MPIPLWWNNLLPLGRRSEIDAAGYLRSLGFKVIASGYRIRLGELDLVAWDGDVLVFVEVKALQSDRPPEDAVNYRKQQRIVRAADSYRKRYRLEDRPYRFDVVAVTALPGGPPELRLLRDAFKRP